MNQVVFNNLSLEAKAEVIQQEGTLLEADDYYSYIVLYYALGDQQVKLIYDFSSRLVGIELTDDKNTGSALPEI